MSPLLLDRSPRSPEEDHGVPETLERENGCGGEVESEGGVVGVVETVDAVRGRGDPGYEDRAGEEHGAFGVGELDAIDAGESCAE